ncbi:MAG: hypothetical protein ABFR95_03480 [Actinomycetota bacterium]
MRTTLIVGIVLLLMVLALPVIGSTQQMDSGATLISDDVLASPGTPHATVKYVEAGLPVPPITPVGTGGHLNIAD